jgi:leader peptidase (prepilin peptidase) / N-methyltransferase
MPPEQILGLTLSAVLGLVMGSAVTAIAYRVPRGRSWIHGRSSCPSCGAALGPRDLIPVLSFLLSRARCRHCAARIAWRYPITELWCGLWAALLFARVGLAWSLPFLAVWGFLLVALFWIDLDFQLLPDVLTLPGALLGIGAALTLPGGARHALFGVIVGSGVLWLLAWGYLRLRGMEGMGFGDIKLAAMFGAVLGWQLTLVTLFLAALAGSIWGVVLIARRQGGGATALPFGSLLAPAAMVAFLWGADWVRAYAGLFR